MEEIAQILHLRTSEYLDRVYIIVAVTLPVLFFNDSTDLWLWRIYDSTTGELLQPYVDQYKPQDGSTTILKFITSYASMSNASGTLVGMALVVLSISAIVEGLLFL